MSNRERILEAALELFNTQGASNTGTNKIAAHLGISPGNLYYHFKNREEIIRTIFPEISKDTDAVFMSAGSSNLTSAVFGDILVKWVGTVWKYRFFYGDLVSLLRNDPELKTLYNERRRTTLALMQKAFLFYAQNSKMNGHILTEEGAEKLAINVWIVALNWIAFLQIEKEDSQISRADLTAGAFQIFALLEPYLEMGFIENVRQHLSNQMYNLASGEE